MTRKITVEIPKGLPKKALTPSQTYSRLRKLRAKVRFSRTLIALKADR